MNISRQIQNLKKNNNFDLALEKIIKEDLSIENINIIFSIYVENYNCLKNKIGIDELVSHLNK